MTPSLSELKVTPRFCFTIKIPDNVRATNEYRGVHKIEKISEYSLDSIPSPWPSVKIQIIGGKLYLR